MSPKRPGFFFRFTAFLTLLTFSFQQISQAQSLQQELSSASNAPASAPVESAQLTEPVLSPQPSGNFVREAVDFFQNDYPLRQVKNGEEPENVQKTEAEETGRVLESPDRKDVPYEQERKSFDEAVEELRPEYASAIILESISEDNVRQLLNLEFETALVILSGEIVLLTSGNEDEIRASRPASRILESAAFTAHTHPKEHQVEGPSPVDLQKASGLEYVLTDQSVYAYDKFDLKQVSLAQFMRNLQQTLVAERMRYKRIR